MGGYAPPPAELTETAAQAQARAGAAVDFRGTYGGPSGAAAQQWQSMQNAQQARDRNQQVPLTRREQGIADQREMEATGGGMGFQHTAAYNEAHGLSGPGVELPPTRNEIIDTYIASRPRYVEPSEIGDTKTQKAATGLQMLHRVTGRGEMSREAALGVVLEGQRQVASGTPGTRDERFYKDQLDLWNARYIEMSAGEHAFGKASGVPQPANRFENVGDIALAFEKAGNVKDEISRNYVFNPNVANVMHVLPHRIHPDGSMTPVGLQEYSWMGAVARERGLSEPGAVSFMPAIDFINTQVGRQGVYGDLAGGVKDTYTPLPSGHEHGGVIRMQPSPVVAMNVAGMRKPVPGAPGVYFTTGISKAQSVSATQPKSFIPFQSIPFDTGNPLGMKVTAHGQSGTTGGIQFAEPVITSSERATSATYYQNVNNWFKSAPGLSYFYKLGSRVPAPVVNRVKTGLEHADVVATVFSRQGNVPASIVATSAGSIYKGGNVFELKTDYEKLATSAEQRVSPMIMTYETELAAYNANLSGYNTQLAGYVQNQTRYSTGLATYTENLEKYKKNLTAYDTLKTESGYNALVAQEAALKLQQIALNKEMPVAEYSALQTTQSALTVQKGRLDVQLAAINTNLAPVNRAETAYATAAGNLMGNLNQKDFITYGTGMYFGDLAKGYQSTIETPLEHAIGVNPVSQFVSGIVSVPRQVLTIGQAGLIGGENLARNAPSIPGVVTAGVAMQAKGTYEQAQANPAGLVGTLVGMYIVASAIGKVGTGAKGYIRTRGQTYVPIETIGYDTRFGYPIKPGSASASDMIRSFSEGKLYPKPTRMSTKVEPPYLHGRGGAPVARLPNAQSGDFVLYTAHEGESLTGGVKVGTAYKMTGTGSSELASISAAPILEGYFAKVGGQVPKMVGFDTPFKGPTAYVTVTEALETIPRSVMRKVVGKDYTAIDTYMQVRSTEVPSGISYIPMIKGEYEANIPTNSIFEVTGRSYYTKLGGFGQSHFLGTRVPIVEQMLVGFEPGIPTPAIPVKVPGSSYKPAPVINLVYAIPSGIGVPASGSGFGDVDLDLGGYRRFSNQDIPSVFRTIQAEYQHGGISKISAITKGAYSRFGTYGLSPEHSATRPSSSRQSSISSRISSMESIREPSLSHSKSSRISPLDSFMSSIITLSKPSPVSEPPGSSRVSSPGSPASILYGGSPGYTPPASPPSYSYVPGSPTPPGTPGYPIRDFIGSGGNSPRRGSQLWGFRFTEKLVVKSAREVMFGKTPSKTPPKKDKKKFSFW